MNLIKDFKVLENNKDKFTYKDIVDNSSFTGENLKESIQNGINLSSAIIWSTDFATDDSKLVQNDNENYYWLYH